MQTPTEFRQVTAVAKANVFFDGRVVSHSILLPDGTRKTLGLIYPGQFHFKTQPHCHLLRVRVCCRSSSRPGAHACRFPSFWRSST